MGSNLAIATTRIVKIDEYRAVSTTGSAGSDSTILFEYLFRTDESLVAKNKFLIMYFQRQVENKNFSLVNSIFSQTGVLIDLHPSLLKSMLIMTSSCDISPDLMKNVKNILEAKMNVR